MLGACQNQLSALAAMTARVGCDMDQLVGTIVFNASQKSTFLSVFASREQYFKFLTDNLEQPSVADAEAMMAVRPPKIEEWALTTMIHVVDNESSAVFHCSAHMDWDIFRQITARTADLPLN